MTYLLLYINILFAQELILQEELEDLKKEEMFDISNEKTGWSFDHEWKPLRLYRPLMAVTSTWNDRLLIMDNAGRIHQLQIDGSWNLVYSDEGGQINEEDLLLDLESSMAEQWDEIDEMPQYDGETEELIEPESLSNEWESAIDDPLLTQELLYDIYTIWTDERSPLVFACWRDGCLRSTNNGEDWKSMDGLPPANDFAIVRGVYVAGTPVGLWISEDKGISWHKQLDVPKDISINDFAMSTDFVVAATSSGVWLTVDGLNWSEMRGAGYEDVEFTSIVLTRDQQIWTMSEMGFLFSDDLGNSFDKQRDQIHFNNILEDELNGGVLAFDDQMVWESQNQGNSWEQLSEGLPLSLIKDATAWKGGFVIVTEQGGYYLGNGSEHSMIGLTETLVEDVDIELLIGAATHEFDVKMSRLSVDKATQILRWVPTVSMVYDYGHDRSITVNYDSISSIANEQVPWKVVTNLCFGNCQTASTDVGFSNLSEDIMVVGNSVYRSDLGGVVPAASNVSLTLHQMRRARIQRIIDLYNVAIRLEQQTRLLLNAPMQEQVLHRIEQDEVTALLDLYTDGKFYSALKAKE